MQNRNIIAYDLQPVIVPNKMFAIIPNFKHKYYNSNISYRYSDVKVLTG